MRQRWCLLTVAGSLALASCSDADVRPSAEETWRRAQLVFPALHIDAVTNGWTGRDKLNEQFGFVCWMDFWPESYPAYLNAEELAAMAVIACPPLDREEATKAVARIGGVDEAEARSLLEQASKALHD